MPVGARGVAALLAAGVAVAGAGYGVGQASGEDGSSARELLPKTFSPGAAPVEIGEPKAAGRTLPALGSTPARAKPAARRRANPPAAAKRTPAAPVRTKPPAVITPPAPPPAPPPPVAPVVPPPPPGPAGGEFDTGGET